MRAGVAGPHHSGAMRQVVKENHAGEMSRGDLRDKEIINALSSPLPLCFSPPLNTHTHTPAHIQSQLPLPQCVFLRH